MINKDAYKLFHEGILAFADVEQNGIRVDMEYCKRKKKNINMQIQMLTLEIERMEEVKLWKRIYKDKFNLESAHQLSKILFTHLKLKPSILTAKGNVSVDKNALGSIELPMVKSLITLRQLKKVSDTYLKNIIQETTNGYMHPFFNLHTVQTFRSSSDRPNFQNIPIRNETMSEVIRKAFIPRKNGLIGGLDYSGIELSMSGCNSKDSQLIKDFTTIHKTWAAKCYSLPEKQVTKDIRYCGKNNFVFPQVYGSWYEQCAVNLLNSVKAMNLKTVDGMSLQKYLESKKLNSIKSFTNHIKKVEDEFWDTYYIHKKWQEKWIIDYYKKGYIELLTGVRCGGVLTKNQLLNYANQGIAFHCLLWSIIQMNKWLKKYKMKSRIIGQIHDDMVMDINKDELKEVLQKAKEVMCIDIKKAWKWIITPLEVEAEFSDKNLYEKKRIEI